MTFGENFSPPANPGRTEKTMKTKRNNAPKKKSTKLSRAVKASWADESVARARAARHAVRIGRTTYTSVAKALAAHGLPASAIGRVRLAVQRDGKTVIEGRTVVLVKE
jgi:hypothetical protein